RRRDAALDVVAQAKQAGLGRHELVFELRAPRRMGEVAGRHHAYSLACRPVRKVLEVEIAAGGARIFRVDVQVRMETHRTPRRARLAPESNQDRKRDQSSSVRVLTEGGLWMTMQADQPTGPANATRSPSRRRVGGQVRGGTPAGSLRSARRCA